MDSVVTVFLSKLTYGNWQRSQDQEKASVVETLARVYEKARNALEYRADHLVRRAAIERILRRITLFEKNPSLVAKMLWDELNWARYILPAELDTSSQTIFQEILTKYLNSLTDTNVPRDWILGVASAEIEQSLNLNVDYYAFGQFTFQILRRKMNSHENRNLDLLLYVLVDKIYSLADEQLIAFHIVKLTQKQLNDNFSNVLITSYKELKGVFSDPLIGKVSNFVRRNLAPFILLRDMYFSNPSLFKTALQDEQKFKESIKKVLGSQLKSTSDTMRRAAFRSILYVFLTKMLFGFLVEVPIDLLLLGHIAYVGLIVNLAFPPITMWLMTLNIPAPDAKMQNLLVEKSWEIVNNPEQISKELIGPVLNLKGNTLYLAFSVVYGAIFLGLFIFIFFMLNRLGFSVASQFIFVFFLCVVAFFAYRIRQYAKIYSLQISSGPKSSLWDMLFLPILAVGNVFSRSLVKLNFLVMAFDFILEAPFKLILQFLNSWVQFLSLKKEEVIG